MRLEYMAHSCFLIRHQGYSLLFDPYDPVIGYPAPRVFSVDLIVVSHDHHDHDGVSHVPGAAQVVRGVARRAYGPLVVDGEVGWHGEREDADPVSLTMVEWDGKRLAHFGDLGCGLETEHEKRFQGLDLLLIPVGGGYTIDGARAAELVRKLKPRVVVPMHFATPFLDRRQFPGFQTVEPFLGACREFCDVRFIREGWAALEDVWKDHKGDRPVVLHLQHQMA